MTEREWLTSDDSRAMWGWVCACVEGRRETRHEAAVVRRYMAARRAISLIDYRPFDYPGPDAAIAARVEEDMRQSPTWRIVPHALRGVVGNPFRPVAFDPAWRTPDVLAVARGLDGMPSLDWLDPLGLRALADALEEAGCGEEAVLRHLRGERPVVPRGCGCKNTVTIGNKVFVDVPLAELRRIARPPEPNRLPGGLPSPLFGVPVTVNPCGCPPKPGELRWEADTGPRLRGDWCLDLVLGRA